MSAHDEALAATVAKLQEAVDAVITKGGALTLLRDLAASGHVRDVSGPGRPNPYGDPWAVPDGFTVAQAAS